MTEKDTMTEKEILVRFIAALSAFYEKDKLLVANHNASERSMTHRLAVYLEHLFPNYNVDCEYNREGKGNDPKKLEYSKQYCSDCKKKFLVYPDIIVHKRCEKENILVIEAKKTCTQNNQDIDYEKLKEFTSSEKYGYTLGIGFRFDGELNDTIQSIKLFPKENDKIKQLKEFLKFMNFGNKKRTQRRLYVRK